MVEMAVVMVVQVAVGGRFQYIFALSLCACQAAAASQQPASQPARKTS